MYKIFGFHIFRHTYIYIYIYPCVVGPCHHSMARPQVAERGKASNMEGSCEKIE